MKKKKILSKKKKNRPSPSESATKFDVGKVKKGNDGQKWIIIKTKKGTKRWSKLSGVIKKTSKIINKWLKGLGKDYIVGYYNELTNTNKSWSYEYYKKYKEENKKDKNDNNLKNIIKESIHDYLLSGIYSDNDVDLQELLNTGDVKGLYDTSPREMIFDNIIQYIDNKN